MLVIRLLLLIKISIILLVAGCSSVNSYKGKLRVTFTDQETIQRTWEAWSGKTTKVRGWAKWGTNDDGTRWCDIYVPHRKTAIDMETYRHELRHCKEGHWHGGENTVGADSNE